MPSAEEFQEIQPGLFCWQAYEPSVKTDLTCCACETPEGLVFIDPIGLTKEALDRLTSRRSPAGIVLTSGNHSRATAEFRERWRIPICAHAAAVPELECPVDRVVAEGDQLFGRLTVIELPGAAEGEIALNGNGVTHVGDALIHLPSFGFAMLPEKYCTDASELRQSLGKLLRFSFEVLTFAHGLPLTAHARHRLSQLLA